MLKYPHWMTRPEKNQVRGSSDPRALTTATRRIESGEINEAHTTPTATQSTASMITQTRVNASR
jgi:hypothetical protein